MMPKKYLTTVLPICFLILLTALFFTITEAEAGGYPWKDHAKPYDFKFGNHIDTHQQTKIKNNGELFGFLYITFIEDIDGMPEEKDGIPVAEHCDNDTTADECEVGWIIRGKFIEGDNRPTFVYHEEDHPTWLVVSRNDIPQPGSFSHFHWLGSPDGGGGFTQGDMRDGYFIELQAVDLFYFRHNNEDLLVMPGIDISTHVNIVGSFPL